MSNGTVPMDVLPDDYNSIKDGDCVTSGTYTGCIDVNGTYYWVSRGQSSWTLSTGAPGQSQVKITDEVWGYCEYGGTYTYDADEGGWYDGQQQLYKWDGASGGDIKLEAV